MCGVYASNYIRRLKIASVFYLTTSSVIWQIEKWIYNVGGMTLVGENRSTGRKSCRSAFCTSQIRHWIGDDHQPEPCNGSNF
jgi:hypothetical protein